MKKTFIIAAAILFAFSAHAAELTKSTSYTANAYLIKNFFCQDIFLNVAVTDDFSNNTPDSTENGVVAVSGSFSDFCEMGISSSFYGTAPLLPGEFQQNGDNSATLKKQVSIDGYPIDLDLTWTGQGTESTSTTKVTPATGGNLVFNQYTANKSAAISGIFAVDGMNWLFSNVISGGGLQYTKTLNVTR